MPGPIRIIIADDHEVVREGIKLTFKRLPEFDVVDDCSNGEELVAAVSKLNPDVVISDIRIPVMDGIQVCKQPEPTSPANSRHCFHYVQR